VQAAVAIEELDQRRQRRFVAPLQFNLEFLEAIEDPTLAYDLHFVDAQLRASGVRPERPHPPQLANRQQLDQGLVAAQFHDDVPGLGGRPIGGMRPGVGRTLDLLAAAATGRWRRSEP